MRLSHAQRGHDGPSRAADHAGRRLAAALVLSLALHAAAVLWLLGGPVSAGAAAVTPPKPPVALGIERSEAQTVAWLGFADPTEHNAQPSAVDQSQLTRAPGQREDNLARRAASAASEALARASRTASRAAAALREALRRQRELASKRETTPNDDTPPEPDDQQAPQPADAPAPEPQASQSDSDAADDSQRGSPGEADDRAADAASKPTDVRRRVLGRVLATQGLRIRTTRLRLTDLQEAFGRPPSPLVEIFFNHKGVVVEARVVEGQGTGRPDVDQALVNAIFEWTAAGPPIERLEPGQRPLLVRMRILF